MATETIYIAFNSRPANGKPYFAVGSVHWNAQGCRNFMGDMKEWRRLSRAGWRIIKYTLPDPGWRHRKRARAAATKATT